MLLEVGVVEQEGEKVKQKGRNDRIKNPHEKKKTKSERKKKQESFSDDFSFAFFALFLN